MRVSKFKMKKAAGHGATTKNNTDWWKLIDNLGLDQRVLQEFFELVNKIHIAGDRAPGGLTTLQCCLLYLRWLQTGMTIANIQEDVNQSGSLLVIIFPWVTKRLEGVFRKWLSMLTPETRLSTAAGDTNSHRSLRNITGVLNGFHLPHNFQNTPDGPTKADWISKTEKRSCVNTVALVDRNGRWLWVSKSYPAGSFEDDAKIIQKHVVSLEEDVDPKERFLINREWPKDRISSSLVFHPLASSTDKDVAIFHHFQATVFQPHFEAMRKRWKFSEQMFRGAIGNDYNVHLRCAFALENVIRFPDVGMETTTAAIDKQLPKTRQRILGDFNPANPFVSKDDQVASMFESIVAEDEQEKDHDKSEEREPKRRKLVDYDDSE